MSPEDYQRASDLFQEVFELDPDERARVLRAKAPSPEILAEVEFLLSSNTQDGFGEGDLGAVNEVLLDQIASDVHDGKTIGPYRIVRAIGEGGMGIVYVAEQKNPERFVAIKLLRHAAFGAAHSKRFEREAELLGRLQHPGIAQIFESGRASPEPGAPTYIAMEYIDGVPITEFARREELVTPQRVQLLIELTRAVHHAHLRGVLHRDLKPSNVLVTTEGQVKVIDFGVARALDADPLVSQATVTGQVIGTLDYMSPEQVSGDLSRVDARADVYALGIMAYELFARQLPHALRDLSITEIARVITEVEPPRLGKLAPDCRGDLELIVGKAIAKEPERRFQSAAALADDFARLMNFEPIEARPVSTIYQLRRLARRHRAAFVGAAATLVAIVVGASVAVHFAIRNANLAVEAEDQRDLARAETTKVLRLSDLKILQDLETEAESLWPARPHGIDAFVDWIRRARELVANLPTHRQTLADMRVDTAGQTVATEQQWQLDLLTELVTGLAEFRDGPFSEAADALSEGVGWSVPRRLAFARRLEAGFQDGGEFTKAWADALPEIRAKYPGLEPLAAQPGLVPLGPDPESKLWEFADLATGTVPKRDDGGKLVQTDETAIVLVLIPGGTFDMGAQPDDPSGPNYDPEAPEDEAPIFKVELSPFLISKFEMTQGQWVALSGRNPSTGYEEQLLARHPVESLAWVDCMQWLPRLELTLATEAQWEYACRGGTTTPWWTGTARETLQGAVNLADGYGMDNGLTTEIDGRWLDDGFVSHAPVGTYAPNPFGLHEMTGNVQEWCLDEYNLYQASDHALLDPVEQNDETVYRCTRGGSWASSEHEARSADRIPEFMRTATEGLGLRAARVWR